MDYTKMNLVQLQNEASVMGVDISGINGRQAVIKLLNIHKKEKEAVVTSVPVTAVETNNPTVDTLDIYAEAKALGLGELNTLPKEQVENIVAALKLANESKADANRPVTFNIINQGGPKMSKEDEAKRLAEASNFSANYSLKKKAMEEMWLNDPKVPFYYELEIGMKPGFVEKITVNGASYLLPRGKNVQIPLSLANYLNGLRQQQDNAGIDSRLDTRDDSGIKLN